MIWRKGDRPVDKHTVEDRILYGLYLTGMSRMEAKDWLKLHDTATVKDAAHELYNRICTSYEALADEPRRPKLRTLHREALNTGARIVWQKATAMANDYWAWWKDRYAEELEKNDVERH